MLHTYTFFFKLLFSLSLLFVGVLSIFSGVELNLQ